MSDNLILTTVPTSKIRTQAIKVNNTSKISLLMSCRPRIQTSLTNSKSCTLNCCYLMIQEASENHNSEREMRLMRLHMNMLHCIYHVTGPWLKPLPNGLKPHHMYFKALGYKDHTSCHPLSLTVLQLQEFWHFLDHAMLFLALGLCTCCSQWLKDSSFPHLSHFMPPVSA